MSTWVQFCPLLLFFLGLWTVEGGDTQSLPLSAIFQWFLVLVFWVVSCFVQKTLVSDSFFRPEALEAVGELEEFSITSTSDSVWYPHSQFSDTVQNCDVA